MKMYHKEVDGRDFFDLKSESDEEARVLKIFIRRLNQRFAGPCITAMTGEGGDHEDSSLY